MRLIGLALAAVPLSACTVSTAQKHAAASPMVAPVPQNVGSNIPATSEFMRAFVDKGRFAELLGAMPVRVILNDRAALLGAALAAPAAA